MPVEGCNRNNFILLFSARPPNTTAPPKRKYLWTKASNEIPYEITLPHSLDSEPRVGVAAQRAGQRRTIIANPVGRETILGSYPHHNWILLGDQACS